MNTTKINFLIGLIISATIMIYSACHPEKYSVLVPISFGILVILSTIMLLPDHKNK